MGNDADLQLLQREVRRLYHRLWTVMPKTQNTEKRDQVSAVFAAAESFLMAMEEQYADGRLPMDASTLADRFEAIRTRVEWRDFEECVALLEELGEELRTTERQPSMVERLQQGWTRLGPLRLPLKLVGLVLLVVAVELWLVPVVRTAIGG